MRCAKMKYSDRVYINMGLKSYGNGFKISRGVLQKILFFIAVLPLCTAWIFPLIPMIKDKIIRYEVSK